MPFVMHDKPLIIRLLLPLCLLLATASVGAETLYVNDVLFVTLRSGETGQHQILKTLPSGSKLELLERSDKYSRVRTTDDIEGWVLSQYLVPTPVARQRLAETENKLATTKNENTRLQTDLASITERESTLRSKHENLAQQHKTLNQELERLRRVSAQPLKLESENQAFKKELLELENNYELLRQEYQILTDSSDREWFIAGAGVIILGIIIGLIAPKLRSRKKSNW